MPKIEGPRTGSLTRQDGVGSSRATPVSLEGPLTQRTRHEEGVSIQGKDKETILIEEEEDRGGETGEGEINTETRPRAREVP